MDTQAPAEQLPPDLQKSFESLAGQIATDPPLTPATEPEPPLTWEPVSEYVYTVFTKIASNWTFDNDAHEMMQSGLTDLLNLYFPGGPTMWQKWGPWAKLLAGLGILGFLNFDFDTKRLKPLRLKHEKTTGRESDSSGGTNPERKDSQHSESGQAGK